MIAGSRIVPAETQVEQVRLYREENCSLTEIGRRTYCNRGTVKKVLLAHGVPLRGRVGGFSRLPADDVQRTVDLYLEGMSQVEVARRLGISTNAVRYRLNRAGIRARDRSTSQFLAWLRRTNGLNARRVAILRMLERTPHGLRSVDIVDRLETSMSIVRWDLKCLHRIDLAAPVGNMGYFRLWHRTDRAIRDVLLPTLSALADDAAAPSSAGFLPAAPFAAWLEQLVEAERRVVVHLAGDAGVHSGMPVVAAVADRLGIPDRRIRAILTGEQTQVRLETADRALTNAGDGTFLWDLWPDLFGGDDGLAA